MPEAFMDHTYPRYVGRVEGIQESLYKPKGGGNCSSTNGKKVGPDGSEPIRPEKATLFCIRQGVMPNWESFIQSRMDGAAP